MTNVQPGCPLCPGNGLLKGPILAQTDGGYLIANISSPGNFLIVPWQHAESLQDLPDDWWHTFKYLLAKATITSHYNISVNMGQLAGQTVKHLHFWIILRQPGQPASGKGFARLIYEANATGRHSA